MGCGSSSAKEVENEGAPKITMKTFREVKKLDTLRQIQKPYEEIEQAAKAKGISVVKEMTNRGYKDFRSFNRQCPPFKLTCWASEFAELGSGYVLYFYFLTFLGLLLLLLFLLQLPILVEYGQHNWLHGWQWSSWHAAFSTEDPCKCVGYNNGLTGLPGQQGQSNYGTTCFAWDAPFNLGTCAQGQPCSVSRPGLWMCRKWCYAADHCPTPFNEDTPSLTNVHQGGLVRSYSVCSGEDDEAAVRATCTGETAVDEQFGHAQRAGVNLGSDTSSIGSHWLTPGNLGPGQADIAWIPPLYLACVCLVCLGTLIAFQRFVITDRQVDRDNLLPNDFAIMVKGLPTTATDEKQILQWFAENSLPGKTVEVVKVVIGWDVEEWRKHRRSLVRLSKELAKVEPGSPEAAEIKRQMADISAALSSAAPETASRLQGSGIVVVVYRYHSDMHAVCRRWGTFWARRFNRDAAGILGCCQGSSLPLFPLGDTPVCPIKVERAPNPGDINWEELAVPAGERYRRLLYTNGAMLFLVVVTFIVTWAMGKAQKAAQEEASHKEGRDKYGFQALSLLPAAFVSLMNIVLTMAARVLGKMEFHDTYTTEEFSQAFKMTLGMIINTMGVLLFQNAQPREWYMRGGLVENLGSVLLLGSLGPTMVPLFELTFRLNYRERRKLTPAKLEELNKEIAALQGTPAGGPARQKVAKKVEQWKEAFRPETMDQPRRFAIALQITLCSIFFMPVMPYVPLVGLLGLCIQYWVDKYMLVRKYRRPEMPTNANLVMFSLRLLKFSAPLTLSLSAFLFLTPSYRYDQKGIPISFFNVSLIIALIFSFIMPMRIWAKCLMGLFGEPMKDGDSDYYKAQYMWSKEMLYHKDHFLYKKLPESLNPSYLKQGEATTVKISDVKDTYGVAVTKAADATASLPPVAGGRGRQRRGRQVLKGGQVMGPAGEKRAAEETEPAARPPPVAYGAPAAGLPPPAPAPAAAPGAAVTPPPRATRAIWEFQVGDHYRKFGDDCQSYIESQYQAYKQGSGRDRITVNTTPPGGEKIKLSIDFGRMTQMKVSSKKISEIRRREE